MERFADDPGYKPEHGRVGWVALAFTPK